MRSSNEFRFTALVRANHVVLAQEVLQLLARELLHRARCDQCLLFACRLFLLHTSVHLNHINSIKKVLTETIHPQ